MQKYFISNEEFVNKSIIGDDAFHIKNVMRGRLNDQILIGNDGKTYLASITSLDNKMVGFEIIKEENGNVELPFFVSLFQGFPKSDKLENIIKYGTQLGVSEIHPVLMRYSVFKLDEKKKDSKLDRFNKIAKEAAEQSYRNIVPKVVGIEQLKKVDFSSYNVKLVCYEESAKNAEKSAFKAAISNLKENDRVAIVVGPEGGISPEEISYLESIGFTCVALGPRILRTETVVFYCLSAISYEWELKK